jgi:hypothetical protein
MAYKILSLDGGGSWALIQARTLGKLYGDTTSGLDILKNFDLVIGNSGGTLNIGGLATGRTPQDMINLFKDHAVRESIFVSKLFAGAAKLFGFGARYDASKKLQGLRQVFNDATAPWLAVGDTPLDQLCANIGLPHTDLIFVGFDYDWKRAQFFRTNNRSPASSSVAPQPTLAEAIHASTNAPVNYFDAPAQFQSPAFAGRRYWDGAITGFNNPVLAGVSEALALGIPPGDIRVLSLGTGGVVFPMPDQMPEPGADDQSDMFVQIDKSGIIHDVKILAGSILDDPPDHSSFIAHLITSGGTALSQDPLHPASGNLVRMSPWVQPRINPALSGNQRWVPPVLLPDSRFGTISTDEKAFLTVANIDMDAIEDAQVAMIDALCDAWFDNRVTNQAIRANADLQREIGHNLFHDAWAAWYGLVQGTMAPGATNPVMVPPTAPAVNPNNLPP